LPSPLFLCIFIANKAIAQLLPPLLSAERYHLNFVHSVDELQAVIEHQAEQIDCLIVGYQELILPLFNQLYEQTNLLPTLWLDFEIPKTSHPSNSCPDKNATYLYHSAENRLPISDLEQITTAIDQAIASFLNLGLSCPLPINANPLQQPISPDTFPTLLLLQQRRLAEKLNERLGYLGVYYKRNSQYYYRNFSPEDKAQFWAQLAADYREIILNYFAPDIQINAMIDQFVNRIFFADLSVSLILEIHMELMDDFTQQLKLEGRSDDILLDYRLTLIDILAHLGEMYRRSIPREDVSVKL
jgi:circadian clock protein KaiA